MTATAKRRIATGLTASEFYARVNQPDPTLDRTLTVPRAVTYRCDDSIYPRRTDWAVACVKRESPTDHCACRANAEEEKA